MELARVKYKQITAKKGLVTCLYRFVNKDVYIRVDDNKYASELANSIAAKGAEVVFFNNWYKINLFKDKELVKLGNQEIDLSITIDSEIQSILFEFFYNALVAQGFKCEVIEI